MGNARGDGPYTHGQSIANGFDGVPSYRREQMADVKAMTTTFYDFAG